MIRAATVTLLLVLLATLGLTVSGSTQAGIDPLLVMTSAQRTCSGRTSQVLLPDLVQLDPGQSGPLQCSYRLNIRGQRQGAGLFVPGLGAQARIEVNGSVVRDNLDGGASARPRSIDRIVLVEVPDAAWRPGDNTVLMTLAADRRLSLSSVTLGAMPAVRQAHRLRALGVVIGPALVAAVVGTLGLCMLLLWLRRRDAMYGYFGVGTLGWAAHTLWTVLPWSPLAGVHHVVWWISLYTLFVVMLIIFCVRFAEGHGPRLDRGLWALALATPLALYAASFFGQLEPVEALWRLLLVGLVGLGLTAVVRAAIKRPDMDKSLVMISGFAALAFGVHDWLKSDAEGANNPIYLVPYAGLVFVLFVVQMLIGRFVRAEQQLELINAELEQRVASQNADLREAIEEMRQARDAAEAADRAKTRFLAAASHDLRQPAHALALYMAALRAEVLEPVQADLVQRMSGSLTAMEGMFNLLLDMSRIDAGALTPAMQAFPIEPMLRQLAEEFAPEAEARGLRLSLRLPTSAAAGTCSDPALVERIVRNLLANAIKYTAQGGVLLACRLRSAPRPHSGAVPASKHWRIEIWDTGVGIAEPDQARVFDEFFQVDNAERDRSKGLGLGLSIVQRLTRLLGLTLSLYSRVGRGSCFALCLPHTEGTPSLRGAFAPALPIAAVAGMTVGMIEDDVEVRSAMRTLLRRWGCTVFEGADAAELQRDLQGAGHASPPQALLIDYRLRAGKTGPAEADQLFAHWGRRTPMLVVTGESDMDQIKAAGHACLAKPVSPLLLGHWLGAIRRPPGDTARPGNPGDLA